MTADEILSRLRGELKRTRPAIPDDIPASSDFQLDWHLDSLDLVEFVSRLETAFSLQIPDEDFRHLVSLTATADYIQRRITHSTQPITVGDDRSYVRHRPHDDEQRRSHAMTYPRTAASDRIVITGVGVLSPLGQNVPDLWARLLAGDSCARPWSDLAADGYRVSTACRIESLDYPPLRRGRTLAIAAATQAVHHAALQVPPSTGVFIGSTMGESFAFEAAAEGRRLRLGDYSVQSFTRGLQRHFRLQGIGVSLGTACAAGNYAVGAAMAALRKRQVSVALAGGVEPFSRLALVGFSRSRAMAQTACRPFDRNRSGMLLGEGAAVFVLERAEDASRRGITPLAEVVALGLSGDAHHPTAPEPTGRGMARAMQSALDLGGVRPDEVDWVNAHGTGTRASDAAEARALHAVFGDRMPLVSGSKGAIGHALGAASAIELAICVHALVTQTVPPTAGHEEPDVAHGIACTRAPIAGNVRWVLNNGFAFGGVNSALLLNRWES